MRIDLNADVGESLGTWPLGEDEAVIPLVSSVNVAGAACRRLTRMRATTDRRFPA